MKMKDAIKGALPMASVWFATHCGGGFATGNQEVNFYVKYGWYSLLLPIFAMIVVGIGHASALLIAKEAKTYNYRSFANALFHPYERYFAWIFEVSFILLAFVAISASIAAAGSLLESSLGLHYYLGITIVGLAMVILTLYGSELVVKALSYQTVFLVTALLFICILGIYKGFPQIKFFFETRETFGFSFGEALFDSLLYIGFQAFGVLPIISVAQKIKSDSECKWFMILGSAINGLFLLAICAMLLALAPGILTETLPVYSFINSDTVNISWLPIVFTFILFIALVSTILSMVFAIVARFEVFLAKFAFKDNVKVRRGIVSTLTVILGTCISVFGLTTIVVKGYGTLGYVGLVFVIIPEVIVAGLYLKRKRQIKQIV